jgi:hypothetical protein
VKLFNRKLSAHLMRLPSGCFTVDRDGQIIASTLPQTFPLEKVQLIADAVLATFKSAQEARLVFHELHITYAALKLTAREMRGGAIIFFMPHSLTHL